jgi:hypothetical protein
VKIADAKNGAVLIDTNGEVWVRTNTGAVCVFNPRDSDDCDAPPGSRLEGAGVFSVEDAQKLGPFLLLGPDHDDQSSDPSA